MTQAMTFPFTDRTTYQDFTTAVKAKSSDLITSIRQAKLEVKEVQRKNAGAATSYGKVNLLRQEFQETQELRAIAKQEANRQYVSRQGA